MREIQHEISGDANQWYVKVYDVETGTKIATFGPLRSKKAALDTQFEITGLVAALDEEYWSD